MLLLKDYRAVYYKLDADDLNHFWLCIKHFYGELHSYLEAMGDFCSIRRTALS